MKFYGICLAVAVSAVLSACGGGGESNQPGEAGQDAAGPRVVGALSLSTPGLQLSALDVTMGMEQGDDGAQVAVDGVVNEATGPVYVFVKYTNNGLSSVRFQQRSANGGRLLIEGGQPKPGVYTDDIRVDVCYDQSCSRPVSGSPQTIKTTYTVTAAQPPATILPSQYGVALASLPFGENLSKDVVIEQSGQTPGNWMAQANVPWLQVTSSGVSGGKLTIKAAPAGLPAGFNGGLVTVMPVVQGSARPVQIRVGLYIGTNTSVPEFDQPLGDQIQVDPARPLVFSIKDSTILIDHVHTGRRLLAAGIPGVRFGEMALSADGARLVLMDADNPRVWVFNTDNGQFLGFYQVPPSLNSSQEARRTPVILKVNGRDILTVLGLSPKAMTSGYYMMDLSTGQGLVDTFNLASWGYDTVHVARDSRHFAVHTHLSPNSMRWAQLTENSKGRIFYTDVVGGTLYGQLYLTTSFFIGASGQDAVSCQGIVSPYGSWDGARIDTSLIDTFTWVTPTPNYVDERLKKQCTDITRFGDDDQFLMIKEDAQEIQARTKTGELIGRWMADQPLTGRLNVTSDQLRVFGSQALVNVPLP